MLFLLAVLVASAMAQLPDCSKPFAILDPAGPTYLYDLSKATATAATGLIAGAEPGNTWTLYLNICGNAALNAVKCLNPTPLCQVDGQSGIDCGGSGPGAWKVTPYHEPGSTTLKYNGGVVVTAGNGLKCGNGQIRQTTLYLKCDPGTANLPAIGTSTCVAPGGNCQAVDETTPCLYEFAPIPWAGFCPMGGGGSDEFDMGWVFVIIVLCGLFLYFVLGIIILKFAMHKEGREVVPQVEFWAALPGLVWDGIKFSFRKITCQTEGYTEV